MRKNRASYVRVIKSCQDLMQIGTEQVLPAFNVYRNDGHTITDPVVVKGNPPMLQIFIAALLILFMALFGILSLPMKDEESHSK